MLRRGGARKGADAGRPKAVRGVVITGAPNPAQEAEVADWSKKSGFRVEWYYYRLGLDLEAAPL